MITGGDRMIKITEEECKGCPLAENAKNGLTVSGHGPAEASLMIVGQNPGRREIQSGAPFVGPSGKLLEEILTAQGIRREDIFVTNAVKCYTEGNKEPPLKAVNHCRRYLQREIEAVKPRYVVTLGGTALRSLTGAGGVMSKVGSILPSKVGETKVIPTLHPAYVLKGNPQARVEIERAFALSTRLLGEGGSPILPPLVHIPDTTQEVVCSNAVSQILQAETIAFDIETNARESWDPDYRIYLIGMDTGREVFVFGPEPSAVTLAITLLTLRMQEGKTVVGHNAVRFDTPGIAAAFKGTAKLSVAAMQDKTDDTILLAHLSNENRPSYSLESLSQTLLGIPGWKEMVTWNWYSDSPDGIPWPIAVQYNVADCRNTFQLYEKLRGVKDDSRLSTIYKWIYRPATSALGVIERNGIYIRRDVLDNTIDEIKSAQDDARSRLRSLYSPVGGKPFNPNSTKQVAHVLFDLLKLKPHHYSAKTAAPSTDELSVKMMADQGSPTAQEFIKQLLCYRENGKLLSTYLLPYQELTATSPRIYPGYSLTTTVTARSSSFGPNLQNVPRDKRVRRVIGAPPGATFMQADYSLLEMRVAAHVANERNMIAAFARGDDLHRATAARILGKPIEDVTDKERTEIGKVPNFALLYCAEAQTFIDYAFKTYGIKYTWDEANAVRNGFFAAWPDLEPWYKRCSREIIDTAQIRSITGQLRRLPEIGSTNTSTKTEALRMGINFCVQNPAAHIAEIALWRATRRFDGSKGRKIVGFIHDAIQLEVPDEVVAETAAELRTIMEQEVPAVLKEYFGVDLQVPLVADIGIGPSWGELEKI